MSPVYTEEQHTYSWLDWVIDFLKAFDYDQAYVDRRRAEKWTRIRIKMVLIYFFIAFCIVVARAFYLQVINADRLKQLADRMYSAAPNPRMPSAIDVSDVINDSSILKLGNAKNIILRMYNDFSVSLPSIDVVASVGIFLGVLQVVAGFHPIFRERKAKRQLASKLSNSLFDKDTIQLSTANYVRTKCTSSDPSLCDEVGNFDVHETEDLFNKLDNFIDESTRGRFFLILADSGMGKTTFLLNYYVYNMCKSVKLRYKVEVIPLAHRDADQYISSISCAEDVVLVLDGFDEDLKAIEDQHTRFKELIDICRNFKCVVMTTRTQFFYCDDDLPNNTGILNIGPRALGVKPEAGIVKTYLAPFDDHDIRTFISKYYKFKSSTAKKIAYEISNKIAYLSARPLLLTYIPEIVGTGKEITGIVDLYNIMIDGWIQREAGEFEKEILEEFLNSLAIRLYCDEEHPAFKIHYVQIRDLLQQSTTPLSWNRVTGRSLLNRDSEGFYKFAHRSIMEFLVVKQLLQGNEKCFRIPLTDFMMNLFLDTTCHAWPLPNPIRTTLVRHKFQTEFITNSDEIFHTRVQLAYALSSLLDARNVNDELSIKSIVFCNSEMHHFVENKSIMLLVRDISSCLVFSSDDNVVFNDKRYDAFWVNDKFKPQKKMVSEDIPKNIQELPIREQIGVISCLNFFGQKPGYDLFWTILNLAQNEILYGERDSNSNSITLKFVPISQSEDNRPDTELPSFQEGISRTVKGA